MKRFLLATTALVAFSSHLFAADLPARNSPFVAPPVFTWAGFYVGGQVGYDWRSDKFRQSNGLNTFFTAKPKADAFGGGVHAGYQLQSSSLVYGLEADVEFANLNATTRAVIAGEDFYRSVKSTYRASLRARLGLAMGPALFYATGGAALANFKTNAGSVFFNANQSGSGSRGGWTAGVGVEYMFAPSWSTRIEYRYTDFSAFSRTADVGLATGSQARHDINGQSVRVGVSYHW